VRLYLFKKRNCYSSTNFKWLWWFCSNSITKIIYC